MKSIDNARLWLNVFLIVSSCHPCRSNILAFDIKLGGNITEGIFLSPPIGDGDGSGDYSSQWPMETDRDPKPKAHFLGIDLPDCHQCQTCTARCLIGRYNVTNKHADNIFSQSWKYENVTLVENKTMPLNSNQCNFLCWCDARCTIYGDCCYDFYKTCLKLNDNATTELFESFFQHRDEKAVSGTLLDSPEYCNRIPEQLNPFQSPLSVRACMSSVTVLLGREFSSTRYYVISRCPSTWADTVRSACERDSKNYVYNIPVNDPANTGLVFKNVYCALCHGRNITQSNFWDAEVACPREYLSNFTQVGVNDSSHSNINVASSICELYLKPRDADFSRSDHNIEINYVRINTEQRGENQRSNTSEIALILLQRTCYFYKLPVQYWLSVSNIHFSNPHCAVHSGVQSYTCTGDDVESGRGQFRPKDPRISLPLLFSFQDSNLYNIHTFYENISWSIVDRSEDGDASCTTGEVYSLSLKSCETSGCPDGKQPLANGLCHEKPNQTWPLVIEFDAVLFVEIYHNGTCTISLNQFDRTLLLMACFCQEPSPDESPHYNPGSNPIADSQRSGTVASSSRQSSPNVAQPPTPPDNCSKSLSLFNETMNTNSNRGTNVSLMMQLISERLAVNITMISTSPVSTVVTAPDAAPHINNENDIDLFGSLVHLSNSDRSMNDACMFPLRVRLSTIIPTNDNNSISELISTFVNYQINRHTVKQIHLMGGKGLLVIGNISIEGGIQCNRTDSEAQVQYESGRLDVLTASDIRTMLQTQGFFVSSANFSANDFKIITCRQVHLSTWERKFGKCQEQLLAIEQYRMLRSYVYFSYANASYRTNKFLLINHTVTFCSGEIEKLKKAYVIRHSTLDSYVTIIGFSLSITCLVLTFLTYCMLPSLRNVPGILVMSLTITLSMAMLLFLVSVNQTEIPWVCTAIASVLHFLWFSVFLWMNALSFDLCKTFSVNIKPESKTKFKLLYKYAVFAIGVPLVTVMCALIIGFTNISTDGNVHSMYGNDLFCWISNPQLNLYWFGIPIAISQVSNLCLFVKSVHGIYLVRKQAKMANKDRGKMFDVLLYFKLSLIMGVTWLLFFLSSSDSSNVLFTISTILNSLNGVFIFIVFVCKKRVLKLFRRKFGVYKATANSRTFSTTGISSTVISPT